MMNSGIEQSTLKENLAASLRLGFPLVAAQFAQMLITVVDTIMLGWLGVEELAAGTLAGQLFFVFLIFAFGIGAAMIPLVAAALGRNDPREVRRSGRMGLWLLFAVSLVFMVPLWFTEGILNLLGQQPELSALAGRYMAIAQWSMIPAFLLIGLRSFLTSLEQASAVMWFTFVTAGVNALLNYAFIFGNFGAPRLEMEGAAIATLLSNIFAAGVTAVYVTHHASSRNYQLFTRIWRPDWPAFRTTVRLGIPISLTILAEAGLFSAATLMMGWLGTIPLAAHGVALQIASLAFMVPLGLSQVASVRVGHAVGRQDATAIGSAGMAVLLLALIFAIISAIMMVTLPEYMVYLFLDTGNPDAARVLEYAVALLFMAALFQIVDGLQAVAMGILRGLSDTAVPLAIAVISYWPAGLTAAWLLGFYLDYGGTGIWAGLAFGLACASVMLLWRFHNREALDLVPGDAHAERASERQSS